VSFYEKLGFYEPTGQLQATNKNEEMKIIQFCISNFHFIL